MTTSAQGDLLDATPFAVGHHDVVDPDRVGERDLQAGDEDADRGLGGQTAIPRHQPKTGSTTPARPVRSPTAPVAQVNGSAGLTLCMQAVGLSPLRRVRVAPDVGTQAAS
jgi:hypothetical protein